MGGSAQLHSPSLPPPLAAVVCSCCSCQGRAFAGLPISCSSAPDEALAGVVLFPTRADLGLSFPSQHPVGFSVS